MSYCERSLRLSLLSDPQRFPTLAGDLRLGSTSHGARGISSERRVGCVRRERFSHGVRNCISTYLQLAFDAQMHNTGSSRYACTFHCQLCAAE
jgi:hypothetical protein